MKIFTIEDVISSLLRADNNPAYKAHATRRLNSYVNRRCVEINAKPAQVIAGVKAAVTKRKSLAAKKKAELIRMAKNGEPIFRGDKASKDRHFFFIPSSVRKQRNRDFKKQLSAIYSSIMSSLKVDLTTAKSLVLDLVSDKVA